VLRTQLAASWPIDNSGRIACCLEWDAAYNGGIMQFLKSLFVAITVLAVSASPVLASLKLCCCSRPVEQKKSCCRTTQNATLIAQKPCCATKMTSNSVLQVSKGCCCIKTLEATSVSDRGVRPDVEKQPLDLAFLKEDQQRKLLTLRDIKDQSPGRFTLSGPRLLALYCTWLK